MYNKYKYKFEVAKCEKVVAYEYFFKNCMYSNNL